MDLPDDAFSDESISVLVAESYELLISSGLSTEERNA
jgi:predicted DNA-binding protein (MmcQ/YjbR family)